MQEDKYINKTSEENEFLTIKGQDSRFAIIPKTWAKPLHIILANLAVLSILMIVSELFVFN